MNGTFEARGFKSSLLDPYMLYGRVMVAIIYVDDVLLFGPDQDNIDKVIKELEDAGLQLNVEGDVYAFLAVEVNTEKHSVKVALTQVGLTNKVSKAAEMLDSNKMVTPAATIPLVTYSYGQTFYEPWQYAYVVLMLMYLSNNSRPDIHFSIKQCDRFTHNIHSDSVKRICLYLFVTQEQVLTFKPNSDMKLDCYVDADFAGLWKHKDDQDSVFVKSSTGYVMTLVGCPLYWV